MILKPTYPVSGKAMINLGFFNLGSLYSVTALSITRLPNCQRQNANVYYNYRVPLKQKRTGAPLPNLSLSHYLVKQRDFLTIKTLKMNSTQSQAQAKVELNHAALS